MENKPMAAGKEEKETKPAAEPTIVQTMKATGGLSPTEADATIHDRIKTPAQTPVEEQEDQIKIRKQEMTAIIDVALVQDPIAGAAVEADGAIAPLGGRSQPRGSLWFRRRLSQHQNVKYLHRPGDNAHVVVPQSVNNNGISWHFMTLQPA
jgi:hypothetical protein